MPGTSPLEAPAEEAANGLILLHAAWLMSTLWFRAFCSSAVHYSSKFEIISLPNSRFARQILLKIPNRNFWLLIIEYRWIWTLSKGHHQGVSLESLEESLDRRYEDCRLSEPLFWLRRPSSDEEEKCPSLLADAADDVASCHHVHIFQPSHS